MFGWFFTKKEEDNQAWRTELSTEWRAIKKKVLIRDNYTCQNPACGIHKSKKIRQREKRLKRKSKTIMFAVHHINDASNNLDRVLDPTNLITLCHNKGNKCHNRFHAWMGGTSKPCSTRDLDAWFALELSRKQWSPVHWGAKNPVAFFTLLGLFLIVSIGGISYLMT